MKRLIIVFIICTLGSFLVSGESDCSFFIQKNDTAERDAFHAYSYNMCLGFSVIDREAITYIHGIKNTAGKTPTQLLHDVGNTFCRGYFGTCETDSYYDRYIRACEGARDKTISDLPSNTSIQSNHEIFIESYLACEDMANKRLKAYKEASVEQIAKNHAKILEKSNEGYFTETHKKMNKMLTTVDTFLKKISDISSHFQGFIKKIYGGK